jgi:hypothetical protein
MTFTGVRRHSPDYRRCTSGTREPATLMPARVRAATTRLKMFFVNQPGRW